MTTPSTEDLEAMGFAVPAPSQAVKDAAKKIVAGETVEHVEVPPTTDDQEFLVHVLGGKPFQKVFRYFGGKVQLTLRTMSGADEELCAKSAGKLVTSASPIEHLRLYREYKMLCSIHAVEVEGSVPLHIHPPSDVVDLEAYRLQVVSKLSGPVYGLLNDAYNKFENVYDALMRKAADPSF